MFEWRRKRGYWAASLAAIVYGGWAMTQHWQTYALLISLQAGMTQATFAFLSTLWLADITRQLRSWRQGRLGSGVVFALASILLLLIPWVFHGWAGTPNWFAAMLPGAVIGHLYLWYLVYYLERSTMVGT
ncbi:MAG: hypothetical protein CL693_04545 [Cellvibrionaceae bacterium]|nr:hypothetical protein [Cellvibrionaceae bacterium]|tara:strand:- start:2009 stop:2398 length:390 start_codon:yes stop_codon:yes gene_type:complete